jgi:hypothetical protein
MATDEALKVLNLTKAELQDTVKIQQVCEELNNMQRDVPRHITNHAVAGQSG